MLNISTQIYAGRIKPALQDDIPYATIIPWNNTTVEKKRLEKLTSHCITVTEYDNIPLPGFTLCTDNRGGLRDWRIIDPRGFIVVIDYENLKNILRVSGISEGLVQERCVWARDNNQLRMELIPISDTRYITAVVNTKLLKSKIKISDVGIGDTVLLQNGLTGVYKGVMSLYGDVEALGRKGEISVVPRMRRQVVEIEDGKYHCQIDTKILSVIKKAATSISREDSIKSVSDNINAGNAYFTSGTNFKYTQWGTYRNIRLAQAIAVDKILLRLEEITLAEATLLYNTSNTFRDSSLIILESVPGCKFLVERPYGVVLARKQFNVIEILEINDTKIIVDTKFNGFVVKPVFSLDNFSKFYKIVKCVRDEEYV